MTGRSGRRNGWLAMAVCAALVLAGPPGGSLGAQGWRGDGGQGPRRQPPGGVERLRERMDERLQERLNTIVRARLQLTDEQFAQLRGVASRMEEERRALRRDEVAARVRLRRALTATEKVDQPLVAQLLDEMPRLERRKVDLMEQEQRELARFLTPSQRARYLALQEELRRGMLELQRQRLGADSSDGPGGPLRRQIPP